MYIFRVFIILLTLFVSGISYGMPTVTFINPGKSAESFWADVDTFAQAAALRLNLQLGIFHAERDYYRMVKEVDRLIKTDQLPDYLILVNEKKILPKLLTLLEGKPVYIIVILNGLEGDKLQQLKQNPHWKKYLLTSLIPNNYWIGEKTAQALIESGGNQAGDVAVISGDRKTPASVEREAGAVAYFKSQQHISIDHIVYADWDEQKSHVKSRVLLDRNPKIRYIWTANDHMAFGALNAIYEHHRHPGKDIFISTINTSQRVLQLRESGEISVLGGGHFTAAGWAMVMINNHLQKGITHSVVNDPLFKLLQPGNDFYQCLKSKKWSDLPFDRIHANENGEFQFTIKAHN